MGLLDDAIREHLDLKRRRGGDPEEIERAEREALGPVRRAPEETEVVGAALQEPAGYEEAEGQWEDETFVDEDGFSDSEGAEPGELHDHAPLDEIPEPAGFAEPRGPDASPPRQHDPDSQLPDEDFPPPAEPPVGEPLEQQDEAVATERGFGDQPAPTPAPPLPASPGPERAAEDHSEETVEYDVEGALDKGEKNDEDVLEETPEFLQDTPDHDRLWFEQRPPRDFDMGD